MEYFDVFTNEMNLTKPVFKNILDQYVKEIPGTPNVANYTSSRKLLAEDSLASGDETSCALHLSEAMTPYIRTMAVYRAEQLKAASDKLHCVKSFVKPVKDSIDSKTLSKEDNKIFNLLTSNIEEKPKVMEKFDTEDDVPLYKRYINFSTENNVENFSRILKELPEEWTVIQLSAPYNPNENIKSLPEYRHEIDSINITLLTNDYLEDCELGPITVNVPANETRDGVKPLFTELFSLLDDNYTAIDNAQFQNNKRLIHLYWNKREDVDMRMKSVINMMDKQWLGGWASLLTGRIIGCDVIREKILSLIDDVIHDLKFNRLTDKQRCLLYNLMECVHSIQSDNVLDCIRKILLEHGNLEDFRKVLKPQCEPQKCTKEFRFLNELCFKCQSFCFERLHSFRFVDGVRAFAKIVKLIKESDEFTCVRKAKRQPVVLIVDERLDTFPWETLPILNHQPVCRMENIHFTYYLYKVHEKNIVDGYIVNKGQVGRYVINPDKNLDRMEKRMLSFVKYWCGEWEGHVGEPPSAEQYLEYLTTSDIFLYCGHGHGCQLAGAGAGAGVESRRVGGVTLLAGCGSTRVLRASPRAAPRAAHLHLHLALCPMVVGMLWEVTDMEADKLISTLVSLTVPSSAPKPWSHVGKENWSQGVLDVNANSDGKAPFVPEKDVLCALSRCRGSSSYVTIASSITARGIPVRIDR